MRSFRRDESLVSIAREVRQENYRRFIFENNAPPVFAFGLEDVLEKNLPGVGQMPPGDSRLGLDGLEDEVSRIDLAMRVRVGDADDFADRKSTRLNSSHLGISYAVFCLKKKK